MIPVPAPPNIKIGTTIRWALAVVLTGILLTGCASDIWVKPGAAPQEFVKDSSDCKKEVRKAFIGRNIVIQALGRENQCLVARGWSLQEQK